MKRFLIPAIAILSLLATACSKYKYETVEGDPLQTRIYTLDNGLKVYMNVNKETPRIQTYIAVKVGGKNDPAETTGLAHYFEHLMFKGTEQFGTSDYAAEKPMLDEIEQLFELYRKTDDEAERTALYRRIDSVSYEASKIAIPNEYDKLMSAIGANGTNAYTSQDMTVYVEDIPSNQIDNWARIQADRFQHPVIRGFHTELETIYEEKNMSLTRDSRKVFEALDAALFPHHPYGTQTVLGTQEHLKNPSITNVKNYHKTYYVPNNMAVCLSGDFDPDEMIATIDKYFGGMEPNPALPKLEFEPEQPITSPIEREVFGLEAENITLGWRIGGSASADADIAQLVSAILYNGKAGLVDLDLNQQQQTLITWGGVSLQPDYGMMLMQSRPKAGQSLDEARRLMLAEVAKLRSGDFDEELLTASINNFKALMMQQMDSNQGRADMYVQSFINGTDWKDEVEMLDRMEKITKEQVVAWAQQKLGPENYAAIYKRQGKDPNEQKISKPQITPIVTNRDQQSVFLTEIQQSEVKPIEPRFVDFDKDMERFTTDNGLEVLYKKNETNDLFKLVYYFNTGTTDDPELNFAFGYLDYLGTATRTAQEIARSLYNIACSYSLHAGSDNCYMTISGLGDNMTEAMEIFEDVLAAAQPDEAILRNLKNDELKVRNDNKHNQMANFRALQQYLFFGPEQMRQRTLTNEAVEALTSEQLLAKVKALPGKQHTVLYYGPASADELKQVLADHHKVPAELQPLEVSHPTMQSTEKPEVVLAQYDAKQLYYLQYSNRGEQFDISNNPGITLYNEYFGGGMNAIVFQEMREARSLAYSAQAFLSHQDYKDATYFYMAFIATQNDKMAEAIKAFDQIINEMPESEAAFQLAKEALIARLRTERTTKDAVLWSYLTNRDLGIDYDPDRVLFEQVQQMTLADVKAAQEKWVKGRHYVYGILGDVKDLDVDYLKTLGPVRQISQEELFGY